MSPKSTNAKQNRDLRGTIDEVNDSSESDDEKETQEEEKSNLTQSILEITDDDKFDLTLDEPAMQKSLSDFLERSVVQDFDILDEKVKKDKFIEGEASLWEPVDINEDYITDANLEKSRYQFYNNFL